MYERRNQFNQFNKSNQSNHSPVRRHTSPDILSAGRQNKAPTIYKPGVSVVDGIPYTHEERHKLLTFAELRQTLITLCRDQYLTYDRTLNTFDSVVWCLDYELSLPAFNHELGWYMSDARAETAALQARNNR